MSKSTKAHWISWSKSHPKYWQAPRYRYGQMVKNAIPRGIIVEISFEEYLQITKDNKCGYCGGPLPISGCGLDRIDNSQGYIQGNCRPCCTICNSMKQSLSVKDFILHMQKVLKYYGTI